MNDSVLDLSYLYEVSGNDPKYVYDIICLFLDNVPAQIEKLEQLIKGNADLSTIQKQAHSLKGSVLFVKIRGLYDNFFAIETLGRGEIAKIAEENDKLLNGEKDKLTIETEKIARDRIIKNQMAEKMENILNIFKVALPLLLAEKEKCAGGK